MLCSSTMFQMRGEGSALLLFRAADPASSLDSPMVQRSRSFRLRGDRVETRYGSRGSPSGWRVVGVRWMVNRERVVVDTATRKRSKVAIVSRGEQGELGST